MPDSVVFLPFPRGLYNDIIRFSDGHLDPAALAVDQVLGLFERNADDLIFDWFGNRAVEFISIYFPSLAKDLADRDNDANSRLADIKGLSWKEIFVPSGAEVRMQYDGKSHHGRVSNGKIRDSEGDFSPSEWAKKVANGTSRSAWRDLAFKFPGKSSWVSAQRLREEAAAEIARMVGEVQL